jgi:L-aspartate oxidase
MDRGYVTAADRPSSLSLLETDGIRTLMWRAAGLFRSRDGLEHAIGELDACYMESRDRMKTHDLGVPAARGFNLLTVARLVARAALRREESRGGHFRQDFPIRDDLHWRVHVVDVDHSRLV